MALLLTNKTYVKFETDGTFYIYKSKAARTKIKKVTNSDDVLAKYIEIISELDDPELLHYSLEDRDKFIAWQQEANLYKRNLLAHNITGHYPLMQQYIDDVDDTIPEIICTATYPKLAYDADYSLKNIYKLAKERCLFGPITEIKDC